jgi:hypothetical protein
LITIDWNGFIVAQPEYAQFFDTVNMVGMRVRVKNSIYSR